MQFEILALAASILVSAILAVWQFRASSKEVAASSREVARALERAVEAIHADIRASQEKLERRLKRGRTRKSS